VNGTAIRTPIPPTVYTTADDNAAVYAIYPPIPFDSGFRSTAFVIVASSDLVGDTVIHPCDKFGQMVGFDLIAHVPVPVHAAALREAGYDLEAVISDVA
jgi:hypothetical protein